MPINAAAPWFPNADAATCLQTRSQVHHAGAVSGWLDMKSAAALAFSVFHFVLPGVYCIRVTLTGLLLEVHNSRCLHSHAAQLLPPLPQARCLGSGPAMHSPPWSPCECSLPPSVHQIVVQCATELCRAASLALP